MKLKIAFDIDGVMVDLYCHLKNILAKKNIQLLDNTDYSLKTNPHLTKFELWNFIGQCYCEYKNTPIFPGAEMLTDILHGRSQQPIQFVTSRPTWAATWTHQLVERFCKVPHQISFADNKFGKGVYLNGIKHFVEDRRHTAKELASTGKIIFMPKYNYNRMPAHEYIIEIDGIQDLIFHIDSFVED